VLDVDVLIWLEQYMNMIKRGEMLPTNADWEKITLQHVQERPSKVILDCDDCGNIPAGDETIPMGRCPGDNTLASTQASASWRNWGCSGSQQRLGSVG
jgi:hypothetical protein